MIRAYYQLLEEVSMNCPDEADFQAMYDARGNRAAQDEIRSTNPDAQHCPMLLMSANACEGCPKNPTQGDRAANQRKVNEHGAVIEWAIALGNYAELGVLPDISRLRPQDAIAAQVAQVHRRLADQKQHAKIIANELAKVLAPILGAKLIGG